MLKSDRVPGLQGHWQLKGDLLSQQGKRGVYNVGLTLQPLLF